MGRYTSIEIVKTPDSAKAGGRVPVTVEVTHTWTEPYSFGLYVEAFYDSELAFESPDRWVYPGETVSFSGSFTMPGRDITLKVTSYVEDGELGLALGWHLDAVSSKNIALIPEFTTKTYQVSVNGLTGSFNVKIPV